MLLLRVLQERRPNALYYVVQRSIDEGENWIEEHAWFWSEAPHWVVINLGHEWELGQ